MNWSQKLTRASALSEPCVASWAVCAVSSQLASGRSAVAAPSPWNQPTQQLAVNAKNTPMRAHWPGVAFVASREDPKRRRTMALSSARSGESTATSSGSSASAKWCGAAGASRASMRGMASSALAARASFCECAARKR